MASGQVRAPRAWVSCTAGNVNVIDCTVTLVRGSGSASTFTAVMSLDEASNPGPAFWSNNASIIASIVATDGAGQTATLIIGEVVQVEIDWKAREVHIEGIDATQNMINQRTQQHWVDTPISAVVSQLAGQAGLSAFIDGGLDMAGVKDSANQHYDFGTDNESIWDAIQQLAEQDGKIAFVDGNTLFFVNPNEPNNGTYSVTYTPPDANTYETSNVATDLHTRRDLQIAQGVTSQVASWRQPDQKPYNVQTGSK